MTMEDACSCKREGERGLFYRHCWSSGCLKMARFWTRGIPEIRYFPRVEGGRQARHLMYTTEVNSPAVTVFFRVVSEVLDICMRQTDHKFSAQFDIRYIMH